MRTSMEPMRTVGSFAAGASGGGDAVRAIGVGIIATGAKGADGARLAVAADGSIRLVGGASCAVVPTGLSGAERGAFGRSSCGGLGRISCGAGGFALRLWRSGGAASAGSGACGEGGDTGAGDRDGTDTWDGASGDADGGVAALFLMGCETSNSGGVAREEDAGRLLGGAGGMTSFCGAERGGVGRTSCGAGGFALRLWRSGGAASAGSGACGEGGGAEEMEASGEGGDTGAGDRDGTDTWDGAGGDADGGVAALFAGGTSRVAGRGSS
jgi:hypothetical protein